MVVNLLDPSSNPEKGTWNVKLNVLFEGKAKLFQIVLVACIVSVSLVNTVYAQAFSEPDEEGQQVTISENLLNDPTALDILKKIEQTKKMIAELEQKEFEKNQAQQNLEKMRHESVKQLNQDLDEWERMWDRYSAKNSFERFANKKPSYVQGVFWDQFEFKEQKVIAGKNAMNKVLINGGTMQDAKTAYNKAAASKKIELIEVNAQFNVKHNLADYAEQQVFNSTGKMHFSAASNAKLAGFYSDYRLQPSYMLANADDTRVFKLNSGDSSKMECDEGYVKVSRVTSGNNACVDEKTAKNWASSGVRGIMIFDENLAENEEGVLPLSDVKTNPGTKCESGFQVVYVMESSEYRCVSNSNAKGMIQNGTAEIHTLVQYVLNKDKQKTVEDAIYEINQELIKLNEDYDDKIAQLNSKYGNAIENENILAKKQMQDVIRDYKNNGDDGNLIKEDVDRIISQIRESSDSNKKRILDEKLDGENRLENELKDRILETVKGYENNPDIDVDWSSLIETEKEITATMKEEKVKASPVKVLDLDEKNYGEMYLSKVGVVNSFGQKFDEIKSGQVLQVAADITNPHDYKQDFAYVVEVKNDSNDTVEPAKWITGTLNPEQTLNVSLSWIPKEEGEFTANVSVGSQINSVLPAADIQIDVNPEGNLSDGNYCKKDYELLFKYSDNSPICATPDTASKLIKIGLAFD